MTWLAVNIDKTFVLLEDAKNCGKTKPGAFANLLGSEKRFEDVRTGFHCPCRNRCRIQSASHTLLE